MHYFKTYKFEGERQKNDGGVMTNFEFFFQEKETTFAKNKTVLKKKMKCQKYMILKREII